MNPLKISTNNGFPWFQSGAGFRPSTASRSVVGKSCGAASRVRVSRSGPTGRTSADGSGRGVVMALAPMLAAEQLVEELLEENF